MEWMKALRLDICILAGLLVIVGHSLGQAPKFSWLVVITTVILGCTTMVQNDWRDRWQDTLKAKYFVSRNPKAFFRFLLGCWIVTGGLVIAVLLSDWLTGLAIVGASILCLLYSEVKRVPFAALTITAGVSAMPALAPLAHGPFSWDIIALFLAVFLLIYGREIIKDIEDRSVDSGYKWTIPLNKGIKFSRRLSRFLVVIAFLIAIYLSPIYAGIGAVIGIIGASSPLYRKDAAAKWIIDISAVLILLGVIIQYI